MEILQEVYIGKVNALRKVEKIIDELKLRYSLKWFENIATVHREINKDLLIAQMGKHLQDQFGFGEVLITISRDTNPNASTMTMLTDKMGNAYGDGLESVNLRSSIMLTKEGIRFDNRKVAPNILIIISMGMLLSSRIESAEVMAALLHEIGHSFSKATIGSKEFDARIDEKFADQFVTMYGYGPELGSVLSKITTIHSEKSLKIIRSIPIVNIFVGLNNIRKSIWSRAINTNVHPTFNKRILDSIKQMEDDLNNTPNLTKSQRKELKDNIKRAKHTVEEFYNNSIDIPDKIYKKYLRDIEPNLPKESKLDKHADLYGSNTLVHDRLMGLKRRKKE